MKVKGSINIRILVIVFFFVALGCADGEPSKTEETVSAIDSVFEKYEPIKKYTKLNEECADYLEKIIDDIYFQHPEDSVLAMYYLDLRLFPAHYSEKHNNYYEKYAALISTADTVVLKFFAIFKESSDLFLVNFLEEYNQFVVDPRINSSNNFDILTRNGYGAINNRYDTSYPGGHFNELKSFSTNPENLWVVDSIVGSDSNKSFFHEITEYWVENDQAIVYKDDKMRLKYEMRDYTMFIYNQDSLLLKHYMISFTPSHKILWDEYNNHIFISLKVQ